MSLKIIFTWWNKQTFGTFLKTLFFGKYVGSDEFGNKYYQSKKKERWVVYSKNIEATRISSEWYLWIHHTVDKAPDINVENKKYFWQKKHQENQTGTENSYKPVRIRKNEIKKNMKLGNKILLIILSYLFSLNISVSEEKIITSPLINVDKIKPSFETTDAESENISSNERLKEKKNKFELKIISSYFNWSRQNYSEII